MFNKKLRILVAASLTALSLTAFADVCSHANGILSCGAGSTDKVMSKGLVQLNGTTVTGKVKVDGTLNATKANLNTLTVDGSANIKQAQVTGAATINGTLNATDSEFAKTLELDSNYVVLANTNTGDIMFKATSHGEQQKLYLQKNSQVHGSITFKQGNGIVYVAKGSRINGSVNGGTVTNN